MRKIIERCEDGRYKGIPDGIDEEVENFVQHIAEKYPNVDLFDLEHIVTHRMAFAFTMQLVSEATDKM